LRDVSPLRGTRVTCYCRDCRAFARYLGRDADVLDANGGSAIYQITPSRMAVSQGADHLACIRLTPKGPLRWHTTCCRSPVGNTGGSRKLPFVGLLETNLHSDDGRDLREIIGASRGGVFTKEAVGYFGGGRKGSIPTMIALYLARMMIARITGAHKKTPFFDADDEPVAKPYIVTDEERAALYTETDQPS